MVDHSLENPSSIFGDDVRIAGRKMVGVGVIDSFTELTLSTNITNSSSGFSIVIEGKSGIDTGMDSVMKLLMCLVVYERFSESVQYDLRR